MARRSPAARIKRKSDQEFYEDRSWGTVAIREAHDLPTLKLHRLLEVLRKRKNPTASLLEVGCGAGRILASVRAHDKRIRLTGADISAHEITLAKRDNRGNRIRFVRANGEHLPFKSGSFEYVIFFDYIEHVDHPGPALRELARVLKPGGVLYGISPTEKQGIYGLSTRILGWHIKVRTAHHIQQYTIQGLIDRVRKTGLTVDDRETTYSYHLLGSIMDYTMFALLLNKRFHDLFWSSNKYYKDTKTKRSVESRIMNAVLGFANAIAYWESTLLKSSRWTATTVHITARKRGR